MSEETKCPSAASAETDELAALRVKVGDLASEVARLTGITEEAKRIIVEEESFGALVDLMFAGPLRAAETRLREFAAYDSALRELRELRACASALRELLRVSTLAGDPGYLDDGSGWECGECAPMDGSGRRATTAEVPHEPDCYQGGIEQARAALARIDAARVLENEL